MLATRYTPPTMTAWQGRADIPSDSCFFQIIKLLNLSTDKIPHSENGKVIFALLGFCCDEGIRRNLGRIGAAEGPAAIRPYIAKLPIQRSDVIFYDAGDIICLDGNLEETQQALSDAVAILLNHHMIPIVIGGGHELAWGHYLGINQFNAHQPLGIINFDAHFDMRPLLANNQGSSGTPFLQIAESRRANKEDLDYRCIGIQSNSNIPLLFNTAKNYHVQFQSAEELQQPEKSITFIKDFIKQNNTIYLSLCLDVFASAYAPGVSAPQPLGLTPWQILPLLRLLAQSGKVISYDIAELSPKYDLDSRTAKLAASFVYEIIHHTSRKEDGSNAKNIT